MAKGKQTIYVAPADGGVHKPLTVEGIAVAATPAGTVVGQNASGLTAVTDATGDFTQQFLVADKDQQRSKTVADSWAINENMVAIAPRSGETINVLTITGQAIVVGAPMARSATAGALKLAATDGTDEIVGYADETVTTAATQLVRVRVA